jgi:hypothetical protein
VQHKEKKNKTKQKTEEQQEAFLQLSHSHRSISSSFCDDTTTSAATAAGAPAHRLFSRVVNFAIHRDAHTKTLYLSRALFSLLSSLLDAHPSPTITILYKGAHFASIEHHPNHAHVFNIHQKYSIQTLPIVVIIHQTIIQTLPNVFIIHQSITPKPCPCVHHHHQVSSKPWQYIHHPPINYHPNPANVFIIHQSIHPSPARCTYSSSPIKYPSKVLLLQGIHSFIHQPP